MAVRVLKLSRLENSLAELSILYKTIQRRQNKLRSLCFLTIIISRRNAVQPV